jgi:hypothetical protein
VWGGERKIPIEIQVRRSTKMAATAAILKKWFPDDNLTTTGEIDLKFLRRVWGGDRKIPIEFKVRRSTRMAATAAILKMVSG